MANVNNNYTDMTNLTPFKLCVLQNFPFIESDFDAVTNYQLLCKVVEYLNKIIENNNTQNDNITQLEQNFITLYNYVKDYFDNLDVQEEINNKLDEMASSGELASVVFKFTGYVTPEMFGAVGNGVTDDTEKVLNTFKWAFNNNLIVVLNHKYLITDTINVKVDVIGSGIIICNTARKTVLEILRNNISISGLSIISLYKGINCNGYSNIKIENVKISSGNFAISLANVKNFSIRNVYIEQEQFVIKETDANYKYSDGIHIYGGCENGVIDNITGTTCDDFICIDGYSDNTVGIKGNINNIHVSNISMMTANILTDNTIIYENASFNIIKCINSKAGELNNITFNNINGKSFYNGGIVLYTIGEIPDNKSFITFDNINIINISKQNTETKHLTALLQVVGSYDITIKNSNLIDKSESSEILSVGKLSSDSTTVLNDTNISIFIVDTKISSASAKKMINVVKLSNNNFECKKLKFENVVVSGCNRFCVYVNKPHITNLECVNINYLVNMNSPDFYSYLAYLNGNVDNILLDNIISNAPLVYIGSGNIKKITLSNISDIDRIIVLNYSGELVNNIILNLSNINPNIALFSFAALTKEILQMNTLINSNLDYSYFAKVNGSLINNNGTLHICKNGEWATLNP